MNIMIVWDTVSPTTKTNLPTIRLTSLRKGTVYLYYVGHNMGERNTESVSVYLSCQRLEALEMYEKPKIRELTLCRNHQSANGARDV